MEYSTQLFALLRKKTPNTNKFIFIHICFSDTGKVLTRIYES